MPLKPGLGPRLSVYLLFSDHSEQSDIRIDFGTNEYPNIFALRKLHKRIYLYEIKLYKYYTNEYLYHKWHKYSNIRHTLPEYDFDTNEYPNIFV